MEITWHGNTCFFLKSKGANLLINPEKGVDTTKSDILMSSSSFEGEKGEAYLIDWPGEYETKGVPVVALRAWTKSRSTEETEGQGEETVIFYFELEGVKFCHLDNLGHGLTSDMENRIGDIDVLMINLSKEGNLGHKKALGIIESVEPRLVIPMGTESLDENVKEIGKEVTETLDVFELKSISELPDDKRKYVVLNKQ